MERKEGQGAEGRPLFRMFSGVPRRYDLLNRVLTWGRDEPWRRLAARECLGAGAVRVLDMCCGTGDLALHLAALGDGVEVVGVDYCEPMLEVARAKARARGLSIPFIRADGAALPFGDGAFDALGIAFAFRNLTYRHPDRQRFLAEIRRVVSPRGRCVIVETSQPRSALLRGPYHLYLRAAVAGLGGVISGQRGAYRYLAESARRYYEPERVADLLREAGFASVQWRRLMGGVSAIHIGGPGQKHLSIPKT